MKAKVSLIALIATLSALLVWLVAFWEPALPKNTTQRTAPPQGGDFTLPEKDGVVALKDYRGKVVLLYFGYTFCPDVCPTSLAVMAQALSSLSPADQERVQGIFISVDPERDSQDRLREYAQFFHPAIIGVTGTPESLAVIARQYGASYMKQKPNAEGLYTVDHSSVTYVIDPQGRLAASLPHASTPQQIVEAVRPLLARGADR